MGYIDKVRYREELKKFELVGPTSGYGGVHHNEFYHRRSNGKLIHNSEDFEDKLNSILPSAIEFGIQSATVEGYLDMIKESKKEFNSALKELISLVEEGKAELEKATSSYLNLDWLKDFLGRSESCNWANPAEFRELRKYVLDWKRDYSKTKKMKNRDKSLLKQLGRIQND